MVAIQTQLFFMAVKNRLSSSSLENLQNIKANVSRCQVITLAMLSNDDDLSLGL